jgi:hypothetical protein
MRNFRAELNECVVHECTLKVKLIRVASCHQTFSKINICLKKGREIDRMCSAARVSVTPHAVIRAAAVLATQARFTLITLVRGSALPIVLSLLCYYAAKAPSVYIAKCSISEHTLSYSILITKIYF